MNIVDEIKSKVNIVELAEQFGHNPTPKDFIFSIYKNENNRSLKLYKKTNSFYDFSTGRGGDVINFYADVKKLDNSSAIKILVEELGIEAEYTHEKIKDLKIEKAGTTEKDIEVYKFLETICGVDEKGYEYLTGSLRGLSSETIKAFRLFGIKNVNETINHLFERFDLSELKEAGLFNQDGRFVFGRHRIIIPYIENEKIIYLRGRVLPEDEREETGKYIGLAGKPAKRLFNTDILKNLNDGSELALCEGEFDTIRVSQEKMLAIGVPGINNFPDYGVNLLDRFSLLLCLDNDEAGQNGMQAIANKFKKQLSGIVLKNFNDATEYLNAGHKLVLIGNEEIEIKQFEPVLEKKSTLKLISAKDLFSRNIPALHSVVKGLLPEGLAILGGRPKCGKSWFAMNVALAVTNGSNALGYFESNKCSVLYVALEDNARRLKDRLANILNTEIDKTPPDNLYFLRESYEMPKLNEGGIEELQKLVEQNPAIKLIIIDTLGRSIADKRRKDNDNYRGDYEITSRLQDMAMKNNICLLVIHHTKKKEENNVFDEISGTTGITGAMDTMMVLKKKGKRTFLYIAGRDVEETEYEMEFSKQTFTWNVVEEIEEDAQTPERQAIIELFKKENRKMKTGEIAKQVGKKESNVSGLLKKLVKEDVLSNPSYGEYQLVKKEKLKITKTAVGDLFN